MRLKPSINKETSLSVDEVITYSPIRRTTIVLVAVLVLTLILVVVAGVAAGIVIVGILFL